MRYPRLSLESRANTRVVLCCVVREQIRSTAMVDGERSMWKVLDDVLGAAGRGPEKSQTVVDQAEKNRRATHAGIAIWQRPIYSTPK